MNANSQNFNSTRKPKTFNNPELFIEGWHWVMPAQNLRIGEVKPVTLLGRDLVVYRGQDRQVVICDAYCPHMGAHLAEGTVEGNDIRCFFHRWKFDAQGICVDIPCLAEPIPVKLKTWPTDERYGVIWVWTGENSQQTIPCVPELEFQECDTLLGDRIVVKCHPNVVMINAIDTQHFHSVHKLPLDIFFEKEELHQNAIMFIKHRRSPGNSFFIRCLHLLAKNIVYHICYWYGSTLTLTIGPDFLHLHLMLALRIIEGGKTEVLPIFLTKKSRGIFGWLFNKFVLWLTSLFVRYFVKDDAKVLQTIRFNLKTPIKADQSIMQLINHVEKQKPLLWGTWLLARSREPQINEEREKWRDTHAND